MVALGLIAVVIIGLVYLRFGRVPEQVSVPAGSTAGELRSSPCSFATENGSYAADCGTLVVPENRTNPRSRLIALPVIRVRSQSDHPAEPIFYLEGGPGLTNTRFSQVSRFVGDRDVVLVGYRGVDGSVRLDCPEVESALKHSADALSQASFRAYAGAYRTCATRLANEGVDLAGYGLPQQVDDLEAARVALGYNRIDLLSQSAGTRTAMIYAWRFPTIINRSVMIGVNPPGHFLWDAPATEGLIARYSELCAQDPVCRQRTDDLAASMRRKTADIPERWLFMPIKPGNVVVATFFALPESTTKQPLLSAPAIFDAWLAAADGDASGLWLESLLGNVFLPRSFVWGEYAGAGMLDAQAARDYFSSGAQQRDSIAYAGSAFAWGEGGLADAWPAAQDEQLYSRVRTSGVQTLLISGELDAATPPQAAAAELLPYLPNGEQVVLPGFGHVQSFFAEQPEAGSRLINTYFATGRVDRSLYQPQTVDFTPPMTAPTTAKKIAGLMFGLSLLAIACVLCMMLWVRRRGRFGRTASMAVRSLGSLMVGAGGWLLGLLAALTAMPGVSLDSPVLAVASTSLAVSLVVYLAWVDRDWSASTKAAGFASAAAGAVLGAWLGLNATGGIAAFATMILGATVGANLLLIALDIARDHRARDRLPLATTWKTLEPDASTG
jgi:pimeloyl-ACP methyl ester carboxylesterase